MQHFRCRWNRTDDPAHLAPNGCAVLRIPVAWRQVILYLVLLCSTTNYLFFAFAGSNVDVKTWWVRRCARPEHGASLV